MTTANTQDIASGLRQLLQQQLGDSRLPHEDNGQMEEHCLTTVCKYTTSLQLDESKTCKFLYITNQLLYDQGTCIKIKFT